MSADNYGWGNTFALLRDHGFRPRLIVDVGANRGAWTRTALSFFPEARAIMIEPQGQLQSYVADLQRGGAQIEWITAGAGDQPGILPLTIAPQDCSSNFGMTPDEALAYGYSQTQVPVRTLDEILTTLGAPVPEMIKIDAEGFDLKVLAGASRLIGRTDIIFIEAAVCAPRIENTMSAVLTRMTAAGYRMIDIVDINRSPKHGVLWLCELAFMREGCRLLADISSYR